MNRITMDQWRELIAREAVGRDPRDDGWRSLYELSVDIGYSYKITQLKLEKMTERGELESRLMYDPKKKRQVRFFRPKTQNKQKA